MSNYQTCSLGGTLGGSLENLTLNSSTNGRSRSRLAGRNLTQSFATSASDDNRNADGRQRMDHRRQLSAMAVQSQSNDGDVENSRSIDVSMLSAMEYNRSGCDEAEDDDDDLANIAPISTDGQMGAVDVEILDTTHDSSCSQSGTPSRKVPWANRKNLSLSFDSDENAEEETENGSNSPQSTDLAPIETTAAEPMLSPAKNSAAMINGAGLCQTDSGFNEMEM